FSAFGHGADGATALDENLTYGRRNTDERTTRLRRARHRLGNGPHATDRVTPGAFLAIHLPEHVVQEHIGGAWGVWASVVTHDAIEPIDGLDRIAFKPTIQIVAGGGREQAQQLAPQVHVELAQPPAYVRRPEQLGQCRTPAALDRIRRSLQHQIPQD